MSHYPPSGTMAASSPPEPAAPDSARPLVIGYGNSLRSDDGIGWHVAWALADDPRAAGLDVIATHQLTPELAEDLHRASRVVLVDACVGLPTGHAPAAGRCRITTVGPTAAAGVASHHHTPASLLALARELYGWAPPVTLVGVGVESLEPGDELTDPVARQLPAIVELVIGLAVGRAGCRCY